MAVLGDGRNSTTGVAVEQKTKSLRTTAAPRGAGFTLSSTTGTIAAAAAASGCFFAFRLSPTSGNTLIFIDKIRLQYTTITAYTTAVTAGRRLSIFRGSGAATTGGTTLTPVQKDTTSAVSQASSSAGGDSRIATTGSLSVTSITWEAQPIREMALTHVGAAGGNVEDIYEFHSSVPMILQPGQVFGIRNPQAMDAAGTWQISVDVDWHESVAWNSVTAD